MASNLSAEDQFIQSIMQNAKCEFKNDVLMGLSKKQKSIPSKYFYDKCGSALFMQITRHPDYYLSSCELEVLYTQKNSLAYFFRNEEFNLIELGPGEGLKTRILLEDFMAKQLRFTYIPIDISKMYLENMVERFRNDIPNLNLHVIHSDYYKGLKWVGENSLAKNLVLFLGSSIGNFNIQSAQMFLQHLWEILNKDDYVFIGFDLKKDIETLKLAYNDSAGLTREFNLNLLRRMNQELGADFNLKQFFHYPNYNVCLGAMESYLVSKTPQKVYLAELDKEFKFEAFEPIHVEYSFKYTQSQLQELAKMTGFEVVDMFYDSKRYFVDVLWRVKK